MNAPDAFEMTGAAEAAGVVNMVNFTYRNAAAIFPPSTVVTSAVVRSARA